MPKERKPVAVGAGSWVGRFGFFLFFFLALGLGCCWGYSQLWISLSGDSKVSEVVEHQGRGEFVLFSPLGQWQGLGGGDYRLSLYDKRNPSIVLIGSFSGGMVRGRFFKEDFLNMAGCADSPESLMDVARAIGAKKTRPRTAIVVADFFWFSEEWKPQNSSSEEALSDSLVWPWKLLLEGQIGFRDFFAPLRGGLKANRYGAKAHFQHEGFGPDGSWYPFGTAEGKVKADKRFEAAARRVAWRKGEFAPQHSISREKLETFVDACCFLRSRGMIPIVVIAPVAPRVSEGLLAADRFYPHFFRLREAIEEKEIAVFDFSSFVGSDNASSCEFLSWNMPGEVLWARGLRRMGDKYKYLQDKLDTKELMRSSSDWQGHVLAPDLSSDSFMETDFLGLNCLKKHL